MSGAAVRFDGQVAVFDARSCRRPATRCLFGEGEELGRRAARRWGRVRAAGGHRGSMQARGSAEDRRGRGEDAARRLDDRRRARHAHPRARGATRSVVPRVRRAMKDARPPRVVLCAPVFAVPPARTRASAEWNAIRVGDRRAARRAQGRRRRPGP